MLDTTASRHIEKTAVAEVRAGAGPRVTYPEVLRVLPDDETRSYALSRFREAGFSADSFAHRPRARRAMVEALTSAEDWLEVEHPRRVRDRDAVRAVRRCLEQEVCP